MAAGLFVAAGEAPKFFGLILPHGLLELTAVVVDNRSSTWNEPGLVARRFATDGWAVVTVDGRDHAQLEAALSRRVAGRPTAVVAEVEAK